MTDVDVEAIRDDHDLASALALALREARATGNVAWERRLHATLSQVVHTLGLDIDDDDAVPADVVRLNGELDRRALGRLLHPMHSA